MNRIFRLVWNKTLGQLVVVSEHARSSAKGGRSAAGGTVGSVTLKCAALATALCFAMPAAAANLAMPGGALLDINNGNAANSASNTANVFQTYTVTFTPTTTGNNYILFAFRQDPAYWTFGNVGLYAAGDSTTNLFTNPLFTQGGEIGDSGIQAPADWGVVYQSGTVPHAAGHWNAPGAGDQSTTNVNTGTAGSWYDGAVGSFDGIYQGVDLVANITYTISFTALSNDPANTAGTGDNDIEMGVFAGTCITLTGPVANCKPNNPDFTVLATPDDASNAGGPSVVTIDQPTTTTDLGATDGAFDGGTLVVDGNDVVLDQDLTISDNGGTIDQNGRDVTVNGTISDETSGTPGDLTIVNGGNGGSVTLTGENTYTGETTIGTGGKLVLEGDGSIASSSGLTNHGTFDIGGANGDETVRSLQGDGTVHLGGNDLTIANAQGTYTGTIDGTGGINVDGGTQTLTGTNTYTGGTSVNNAAVSIDNGQALGTGTVSLNGGTLDTTATTTLANAIDVMGTGTVDTNAGTTLTHSGSVTGNGDFVKDGAGTLAQTGTLDHTGATIVNDGTLVLSGDNTYGGGTIVNASGTLEVSRDENLGAPSGDITLIGGGTLHTTDTLTSSRDVGIIGAGTIVADSGTTLTLDGTVSGSALTLDGGGTVVLGGSNIYSDGTTVTNGTTVSIAHDTALGNGLGGLVLDNGTLNTTANDTSDRAIAVVGTGTIDTDGGTVLDHSGAIAGSGDFIKDGEGTLNQTGTLSHSGKTIVNDGTLVLSGINTYAGDTVVNTGAALAVSSDVNLGGTTSELVLDGGTLIARDSLDTSRDVHLGNGGGYLESTAGHTLTLGGVVDGAGGLSASGSGTLVLGGSNTYAGGTTIGNLATVEIASDDNLGAAGGGIDFDGGTLHSTGDVDSARDMTLSVNGGHFTTDGGTTFATTGDVTGLGYVSKDGAGTLQIDGNAHQSGGFIVTDGTLVLNGENDYLGSTIVVGGSTLRIDNEKALGAAFGGGLFLDGTLEATGDVDTSKQIVVLGKATLDVANGAQMTAGGAIGGTGALVKDGEGTLQIDGVASHTGGTFVNDGTLVLTGDNTYTGGNTINGGTLQVGADANLGASTNGIDLAGGSLHTTGSFTTARDISLNGSGAIETDDETTLVATGNVAGVSGLVKEGMGTLDLSGVASHSGGTTVNDGTLILRGNNTYTGGTTINGGSLQVSSDANLGDASGDVAINGGDLTVTQTMTTNRDIAIGSNGASITTLDGVTLNQKGDMSGTGGLVKLGGGTLVVSGNNSFTGGTLIDGGVIRIDSGSSLGTGKILLQGGTLQTVATLGTGQQVVISGNSGVNVDAGTTTVLSGNLVAAAGDSCFVKSGKGKLSLTGSANLGSGTCVREGQLSANGELTSAFVQVDAIATLRGTGHITGPVNVDGRLAPGNSPGTLTVAGTVTMNEGSTLQVDIDGLGTGNGAGNYSRLLVTGAGNAFIADGTLAPLLRGITGDATNTYTPAMGSSYRIVTAEGGIVGRFASLEQPTSGLAANTRFLAFYGVDGGHSIDLRVTPVSYAQLLGDNAKRNGLAAAGALDGAVTAQDADDATAAQTGLLYAVSSLGADRVAAMVDSLSGEVHADQAAAARNAGLGMQRDVTDHLGTDVQAADAANHVWANLTRDGNRSIADGQGSGFETGTDRTTAGIDLYAEGGTVIGVAATHHDTNVIAHGGSGTIRGNSGIVYAQQALGGFVLDGMAARGTTDWTTRRADPLGGEQLDTRTSGKDTMASATLRMPMQTSGGNRIEPYASVVWQKVERDALAERGDSVAALSLDKLSEKGTRVLAGVMFGSKAADPLATTLTWRAGIAAGADTGDLLNPTVQDTLAGQRFDTAAPGVGRGFVQVNANGTMRLGKSTYLYGGLTAEEGSRRSAYGVTAGVRVAF